MSSSEMIQVADRVHAYIQDDGTWGINNTGVIVGDDTTCIVDTCFTERRTRQFRSAAESVATTPFGLLVNTHHHGDHTYGNSLFPEAMVVGHRRCREQVLSQAFDVRARFPGVEWGEVQVRPPSVVVDDDLGIDLGGVLIEIEHVPPAHSDNDLIVRIPSEGVVFAGDLIFHGGTPFFLGGSLHGLLDACDRLESLDAAVIVPGHGRPGGVEMIHATRRYVEFVEVIAIEAIRVGATPLEAARAVDLGEFAALNDGSRLVGNLHRAMAELIAAETPGARPAVDVPAAWDDMQALDGGPIRSHA